MKKQVGLLEIAGIFIGPAAGYGLGRIAQAFLASRMPEDIDGLPGLLLAILVAGLVPSLLSVSLSGLLQSRRYRVINTGISTFIVVVQMAILGTRIIEDFPSFVWWSLFVATSMAASLVATLAWKALGEMRKPVAATPAQAGQEARRADSRPSLFLTILAILSIPVVIINVLASTFITLGAAAALLLILFELPRIPVFLLLGGALAPLAAIWATFTALKAIIRPARVEQAAILLDRGKHGALLGLIDNVAGRAGALAPDAVILHVEPTFFVTKARMKLLDGEAAGRILALGMPIMRDIGGRELQAVLAHEFAHFAGKDVLYSRIVAPAYRGLGAAYESSARLGTSGNTGAVMAVLRMPSLFFLAASHEYFATIDMMLSRGRELRADRLAARLYGKDSLVSALEKATLRANLFARFLGSFPIKDPASLFVEVDAAIAADQEATAEVMAGMEVETEEALDSHPSLRSRVLNLPDLPGTEPSTADWDPASLFDEEKRLAGLVVKRYGLPLATDEADEADEAGTTGD